LYVIGYCLDLKLNFKAFYNESLEDIEMAVLKFSCPPVKTTLMLAWCTFTSIRYALTTHLFLDYYNALNPEHLRHLSLSNSNHNLPKSTTDSTHTSTLYRLQRWIHIRQTWNISSSPTKSCQCHNRELRCLTAYIGAAIEEGREGKWA